MGPGSPPIQAAGEAGALSAHRSSWEECERLFLTLRIFLSLLVLGHSGDTSLFGLLLTCTRTFAELSSRDADKVFSLIRSEVIALRY